MQTQGKDLEDLMWELLRVDKRVYGTTSAEVANDSDRFGRYLASKQSYGEAEQLLRKALTMKERSRGKEHPEIAGWVWVGFHDVIVMTMAMAMAMTSS